MDKYSETPASERPLEFEQAQDRMGQLQNAIGKNSEQLAQARTEAQDAQNLIRQKTGSKCSTRRKWFRSKNKNSSPKNSKCARRNQGGQKTTESSTGPEAPEPTSEATGDLGRNLTSEQDQFESGVKALSGRTAELESGAVRGGESALTQAGAVAQDTINGVRSGVGNIVENTANKALTAVKSTLPESIGDFLGTGAGEVLSAGLDAIPVVGEVASVVTGLVSLFEGLDKKKEDAQAQAKAVTGNISGQAQTAIDPTAITKAQPVMGATLV